MSLAYDSALLAAKDLRVEMRSRHALASGAALGGTALLLAGLATGPDLPRLLELAPSLIWLSVLWTAIAISDRLDQVDRVDGAFEALWLVIEDRRAIYLGRVLALTVLLVLLQIVVWSVGVLLMNVPLRIDLIALVPLLVLTATVIATVTALVASLVGGTSGRLLLLPVLVLPLLVPVLLAGIQASGAILAQRPAEAAPWLGLLLVQGSLYLGGGLLVFDTAVTPE